jgi:PAS domain S-box-containing protein
MNGMKINETYIKKINRLNEIIDQQKEELLRLATVEMQLNASLDIVAGIHWWKDKNGIYRACNDAMVSALGLKSKSDIVGKSDYELPWSKQADILVKNDHEVMKSGQIQKAKEELVETSDGIVHTFLVTKAPLYDVNNKIVGTVGSSVDVTQNKKMEVDLEKARLDAEAGNKSKSDFIANMSHDIRTPLTGILGLIQELIDTADNAQTSLKDEPDVKKNYLAALLHKIIKKIQEDGQLLISSADELLQLLNEILETMRLESGKALNETESFNLRHLINHNLELMKPIATHKKIELFAEIDKEIPTYFTGHRNYLDRTLLNLLSNALKFTEKGYVKIEVKMLENPKITYKVGDALELQISVIDTGIGIPEDKFSTIFEHFSRLTPSYQGIYHGAGLGLYTVKNYIKAMHAKIKVNSTLDKGTTFIIKLPLQVSNHSDREKISYRIPKKLTPMQLSSPQKSPESYNAKVLILVIEDNLIAAKAAQASLNRLDSCASDIASTGKQAIEMAQTHDYDLILMDIGLPDIEGIEVTRQIRALNHKTSQVPILGLTGHGDDFEISQKALDAGMQAVFTKPLQISKLEAALEKYVYQRKSDPNSGKKYKIPVQILDWKSSLQNFDGNEEFLREILSILFDNLKTTRETLDKAYNTQNNEALRKELHSIRGAIAYLVLPELDKTFSEFHKAIKEEPKAANLKQIYAQLQKAILNFGEVWKRIEARNK